MSNFIQDVHQELVKESKQCLPVLKEIAIKSDNYYSQMNLISKPVLIMLLEKAIEKIAKLEDEMYYEIDAMDALCEREFVFEDLVKECIEHCELFMEE